MTIAIVCGTRDLGQIGHDNVFKSLDELKPDFIIEGGYRGVDTAARRWARHNVIPCATVCAPWEKRKGAAGPMRNGWMLRLRPDVVIAFPGGIGTANMVKQAKAAGVRVVEPYRHEENNS